MREIKFRGFDETNKVWRYGHYYQTCDSGFNTCHIICDDKNKEYSVNRESVGQFTGIMDKNNNEIYEDDLIAFLDSKKICHIFFDSNYGGYVFKFKPVFPSTYPIYKNIYIDADSRFDIKVIGNKYENPELLKDDY